jgi:hypothetical protein
MELMGAVIGVVRFTKEDDAFQFEIARMRIAQGFENPLRDEGVTPILTECNGTASIYY